MTLPETYQKLVAVQSADTFRTSVEVQTVPFTPPQAGEVVIKTAYSGVNAADYLMAMGRYLAATPHPFDMGAESVGVVVAVGEGVEHLQEGDPVLAIGGGYRDYFTILARRAIKVPAATSEMVSLGVSGLTASIALEEVGDMTQGETVLVTAAAGGTGAFAVQLAKLAGNHVIGTCGSQDKVDFLKSLGCDRAINYRTENLKEVLKAEYPKGINIVFESVGGEMYDTAVNALANKGRLVIIGAISEYESGPQLVTGPRVSYTLLRKSASLRGFWLMHYLAEMPTHITKLVQLLQGGQLKVAVDPTEFKGVTGAIEAVEYLYEGKNLGKVVVKFD